MLEWAMFRSLYEYSFPPAERQHRRMLAAASRSAATVPQLPAQDFADLDHRILTNPVADQRCTAWPGRAGARGARRRCGCGYSARGAAAQLDRQSRARHSDPRHQQSCGQHEPVFPVTRRQPAVCQTIVKLYRAPSTAARCQRTALDYVSGLRGAVEAGS